MQLNSPAQTFLEQTKIVHSKSGLPYCLLDDNFAVIWCNEAAIQACPPLALPNGMDLLLEGYHFEDVKKEVAVKGRFSLFPGPGNLFGGHGLLMYAAPPECGELYILQPREPLDQGSGMHPEGITRTVASFESSYRSSLTTIFSCLALLQAQKERMNLEDPALEEYLYQIGRSSMEIMRANQMVSDYTKLANGLYRRKPRRVDLFAYLATHLDLVSKALAQGDTPPLFYEIPSRAVFTVLETTALHYIICQLISNACQFTRPGNSITVTARLQGENAVLLFTDKGLGIPAAVLSRIFEPYYSYSSSGAPFVGTGLGLAIAKECAAVLGGDLTVVSVEGQGTTFRLVIPLKDDEDALTMAHSPEDTTELASAIRTLLSNCIPCVTP